MFGNEEGADYGVFTTYNTVTYERIFGEDGIEIIRLTSHAEGSITTVIYNAGVAIGG